MWRSSSGIRSLRHLFTEASAALNLIFPPLCPGCAIPTEHPHRLCTACREQFPHLPSARCPLCSIPFATYAGSQHLCGECLLQHPTYDAVIAGGCYEGLLRDLIHRFKYRGEIRLERTLSDLLRCGLSARIPELHRPALIPIPLHPSRLRERGYNQSLLIARSLGRTFDLPVLPSPLSRVRPTAIQQTLGRADRHRNVRGAFRCLPLDGIDVILIDDVMTSGATVGEAALMLKRAGAGRILVGALARASRW